MAITESFSGSATIGTTQYDLPSNSTTVSAQTTDGIYQLFLDLNALTSAEQYTLRIYEKVTSAATQRVIEEVQIYGSLGTQPNYVTPSMIFLHGWTYTLQRVASTGGTDKTILWSIRQVA